MFNMFSLQIIESFVVIAFMFVLRLLSKSAISRTLRKFNFSDMRRRLIVKFLNIVIVILSLLTIAAIWGIDQDDLFLFISSLLTVIGVAFFAQWSLLSNITSGLILFFNHPMKLGDTIEVYDKDYPIVGVIKEIGDHFVHIETLDGVKLTIPNSILVNKMVSVKE